MRFSDIVGEFDKPINPLYRERDRLLSEGRRIVDLVSGNVHDHGIRFPSVILAKVLASAAKRTRIYRPHPLGQLQARRAIAHFYAQAGISLTPEQLLITPGTSISYWYALRALLNPGDEILTPAPTYPLFDAIASLCHVRLVSYPLIRRARWEIDFSALEAAITPRTRAIALISPHNPTGAVATESEIRALVEVAKRHDLAILADEVFSPFVWTGKPLSRPAAHDAPLVITLNGFSKMFALPGLKIGWMAITGRPDVAKKFMRALDMISDTFLPVNEMAQAAVPMLFKKAQRFAESYVKTMRRRVSEACKVLATEPPWRSAQPEGGYYTVLPLPSTVDEEQFALRLLRKHHILVHPGYFYELPAPTIVLSLVGNAALMKRVARALHECLRSNRAGV